MNEAFGIGRWLSFGVSWTLVLMALWGCFAFFPRKSDRGNNAPAWLILAIWMGFLSITLNTLYWRVFGDLAVYFEWFTSAEVYKMGSYYGDPIWKSIGIVSIYLYFFARWKAIPNDEQRHWTPLMMGFYPNAKHWAVRYLTFWKEKARYDYYSKEKDRHNG